MTATYGEYVRSAECQFRRAVLSRSAHRRRHRPVCQETLANSYFSYGTESIGGTLKFGIPLREDFSLQLRYSLYTQSIQLPSYLDDCNNLNPDFATTFPTQSALNCRRRPRRKSV